MQKCQATTLILVLIYLLKLVYYFSYKVLRIVFTIFCHYAATKL